MTAEPVRVVIALHALVPGYCRKGNRLFPDGAPPPSLHPHPFGRLRTGLTFPFRERGFPVQERCRLEHMTDFCRGTLGLC